MYVTPLWISFSPLRFKKSDNLNEFFTRIMDIMGVRMMSKSEGRQILKPDENIKLGMNLKEMHLFDADTTRVIY